jgi:hypothetical protein
MNFNQKMAVAKKSYARHHALWMKSSDFKYVVKEVREAGGLTIQAAIKFVKTNWRIITSEFDKEEFELE